MDTNYSNNRFFTIFKTLQCTGTAVIYTAIAIAGLAATSSKLQANETLLIEPTVGIFDIYVDGNEPDVSADGRIVVLQSAIESALTGNLGNQQIYAVDRLTGETSIVSVSSSGSRGNGDSESAEISADGRIVVFASEADNLVTGDVNGASDIFVHDRDTGITELVSRNSEGVFGNDRSLDPAVSPNGRYVVFSSVANNLFATDNDPAFDVFLHDRVTNVTEAITEAAGTSGVEPSVDASGRFVTFSSLSNQLVPNDTNLVQDIFLHDRFLDQTNRVSLSSDETQANESSRRSRISASGEWIVFESNASNLVPDDSNEISDVFRHNRITGNTDRVSVATGGQQGNDYSGEPDISGTGRYISFRSFATNLVANGGNRASNIFVRDVELNHTRRESEHNDAGSSGGLARDAAMTGDGRYVVFTSTARLANPKTDSNRDVFLRDRGKACDTNDARNQLVLEPDTWTLLSLPCEPPRGSTIGGIFSDDIGGVYGVDWIVFVFDPTLDTPNYVNPGIFWVPRPGVGFWIQHVNAAPVTLDLPGFSRGPSSNYSAKLACTSDKGCRSLTLSGLSHPLDSSGNPQEVLWNFLGSPALGSDEPVLFNDLRVTTSTGLCASTGTGCTLDVAESSAVNVLANVLFSYETDDYEVLGSGSTIDPWQGLWVGELPAAVDNTPVLIFPERPGFF